MYEAQWKHYNRLLVLLASLLPGAALAAPGNLVNSPLFLSTRVQPNIYFLIDDSGSMGWSELWNKGTQSPGAAILTDWAYYNPPGFYGPWWDHTLRRLSCRGFNVMAYDPSKTYTPWVGKDSAGNDFANLTLTTARSNPYNTTVTNISDHYYWVWNDMDGDGKYDGPGSTDVGANANPATDECGDVSSNAGGVAVSSLSTAQKQNYANWYSYYRNREYVAKRALTQIVKESTSRVGLNTLHNNNNVATPIKDIDDVTTPVDGTAQTNKNNLLSKVIQIYSSGGTPLRQTLENAGKYYHGDLSGSWTTPILDAANGGECQQNFTILMSDGQWNGGDPSSAIGDDDSDNNTSFDGDSYADGDTSNSVEKTLADVAMHYYETDLSALDNQVPTTSGVDDNAAQHMVTYTAAFGLDGTLTSNPPNRTDPFNWPTPVWGASTTIDDMRHAAWNGRGSYLSAGDPQQLINALNNAIGSIADRSGSAAAVSFNTGSLEANSVLYLVKFNSYRWSGNLLSYPLDPVTGAIAATSNWDAATVLDSRDLGSSPRTILTHNGTDGVAFSWSNLSATQKNDLKTNPSAGTDNDAAGMARLGYLRGDRNCEQGASGTCSYSDGAVTYTSKNLRTRNSALGDIIHSSPVYVGAPQLNWPDGDGATGNPWPSGNNAYSVFKTHNSTDAVPGRADRKGIVYVGANDGMLHAFLGEDSATGAGDIGKEVLGYIPGNLFATGTSAGLHYLTDSGYTHRYYVDLGLTVSDAYIKTTSSGSTHWSTVLVGGQRGGGRGLFALDVTDASKFSESGTNPADVVLWEFTDADLGYTFSQPTIVLLNNDRWAAIFGNGYNDTGSGEAQLYILFLDGGLDGTWTDGSGSSDLDYIKITTKTGTTGNRNGLASPAVVDLNGDGVADRVYAGDLQGNLWVFDLSSSNSGTWGSAYKQGSTPKPLFTAKDSGGTPQPITAMPTLAKHPTIADTGSNDPNLLVMFGTGQYLTDSDKGSTGTQSFYGVWDQGTKELLRANLQQQTFLPGFPTDARVPSNTVVDYNSLYGWYIDLSESGERVVTEAFARGEIIYFNTTIPSASPCQYGGTGWLMGLDFATGGRPDHAVFDYTGDGIIDASDLIDQDPATGTLTDLPPGGKKFSLGLPSAPKFLGQKRYTAHTGTEGVIDDTVEKLSGANTGRLSWEEIAQ